MATGSPLYVFGLGLSYLGLGAAKVAIWLTPAGPSHDQAIQTYHQMRAHITMAPHWLFQGRD